MTFVPNGGIYNALVAGELLEERSSLRIPNINKSIFRAAKNELLGGAKGASNKVFGGVLMAFEAMESASSANIPESV